MAGCCRSRSRIYRALQQGAGRVRAASRPSSHRFDIDRTGFSPQVAEELGDYQYLDPNEVNRRFIILTPAQIDLPVVHTAFSNTSQLVYEFMSKNSRAIDALTIKDVIYGEIEDSVAKVDDIEDLLSINQVEFRVLSAEDVLGKAAELGNAGRPAEAGARRLARQRHARPAWSNSPRSAATSARTRWCRTR